VPGRLEQANAEHRAIFEAVVAGDADRARLETQVHLENVNHCLPAKPATARSRFAERFSKGEP
jgi:DNA-binding FadR family transcriptional regulator